MHKGWGNKKEKSMIQELLDECEDNGNGDVTMQDSGD